MTSWWLTFFINIFFSIYFQRSHNNNKEQFKWSTTTIMAIKISNVGFEIQARNNIVFSFTTPSLKNVITPLSNEN
jgi:hypothetical protein